ncbi:MAG: YbjN domain-containing protein [Kiritimatiellae bacterium]|nr:YbjN domain-containing protein [Kiritimatiellia bacterium]
MKNARIMIGAILAGTVVSAVCATTNGIGSLVQVGTGVQAELQSGKVAPKVTAAKKKAAYKGNAEFVKGFLDEDEWKYEMEDKDDRVIFTGGIGLDGPYNSCQFILMVDDDLVQTYTILPASAKTKKAEIAEFITRANYGNKYGGFEMDYSDGEIRYHMTLPIEAIRADRDKFVKLILVLPAKIMDKYAKGIAAVLLGIKTPETAVEECEADDE